MLSKCNLYRYNQCVSCTLEEFQDLVAMNVPSFSQKRALLKRLRVMVGLYKLNSVDLY